MVKRVGGSGGYGMLVGPHATPGERAAYAEQIRADPADFISQPVLALSRAPCFVEGRAEPRHVDLRPFVLRGRGDPHRARRLLPGGAAPGKPGGELQPGGGGKDLWVLED